MRYIFIATMLVLLLCSGCGTTITGHITLDKEQMDTQAINACVDACAKCNPTALKSGCRDSCQEIYINGGVAKLQRYTELYSAKCKQFV